MTGCSLLVELLAGWGVISLTATIVFGLLELEATP